MSKIFKVGIHQPNFSEQDLVVNPKDFQNGIKEGDIVEIYQVFEDNSSTCKLLLQIQSLQTDFQQKETISIKHSVANVFKFRAYWDVHVRIVNPQDFILDLVELKFKDQYFSRSDMWRFGKTLVDSSVYTTKKLSFAGARTEVHEMWATGESSRKVTCGVIGQDTRVVFRSASASVFIFLQMSKEMWEFDINGDLYFEKSINGFLMEVFTKWKEMKCNHAVTIVYFSRIFYDKNQLNFISDETRNNLGCDYKGRLYEDIYRVIVHQERRDDWSSVLVTLKKHFIKYRESFHGEQFLECPLSSASEGNFLEVLNLGANVLEKSYIDRNLEGTGQQMVVVTPGAGMFEVDRQLATMTKRKIVDNGMSADLVCMAEQPLHSIPLLKFHGKMGTESVIGDDYDIPHWINHSFYTSKAQLNQRNLFIPRIKVPDFILHSQDMDDNKSQRKDFCRIHSEEEFCSKLPDFVDYDAYDAEVFKCAHTKPRPQTVTPGCNPYAKSRECRKAGDNVEQFVNNENLANNCGSLLKSKSSGVLIKKRRHNVAGDRGSVRIVKSLGNMLQYYDDYDEIDNYSSPNSQPFASARAVVGSADTSQVYQNVGRPQRALLNPFRPHYLPCKLTCNRHRWRHTFPKGPGGEMLQEHHHRISETVSDNDLLMSLFPDREADDGQGGSNFDDVIDHVDGHLSSDSEESVEPVMTSPQTRPISATIVSTSSKATMSFNLMNLGWVHKLHAPSEEDWTAAVKTLVDWKSLTIPACLPVTTDYFPDERLLNTFYKVHNYELFIGEENDEDIEDTDGSLTKAEEAEITMNPDKIFKEFISQRIGQGFQLVCYNQDVQSSRRSRLHTFSPTCKQSRIFSGVIPHGKPDIDYYFMRGRNFHKITTPASGQVSITRYHPTHVIRFQPITYTYSLWSRSRQEYIRRRTPFVYDDLTNYNWNYLDQYVSRDIDCLHLTDSLQYCRVRFVLLPLKKPATSLSSESEEEEKKIQYTYLQGILRFLETVNRIKRPSVPRLQTKKMAGKPRRPSTPCTLVTPAKSPMTAVRSHRRSRSGGGLKDMDALTEGMVTTEFASTPFTPEKSSSPVRHRSSSSDRDSNEENVGTTPPSLEEIFKAMSTKETGVTVLPEMRGLPPGSFLGTDATSWLMNYVHQLKCRPEAVELGQKLLDAGFIQHASRSLDQRFVDGFYLYYIVKASERNNFKRLEVSDSLKYRMWKKKQEELLEKFQFRWFEVVMRQTGSEETRSPFTESLDVTEDELPNQATATKGMSNCHYPQSGFMSISRDVEINLQSPRKNDRPEWCTVRYHGYFCPDNAYEVHLRWLIATGPIINELVQSWARKVTTYGFHLVPAPTFLLDGNRAKSDPFLMPHFLPLKETCFQQFFAKMGFDPEEYKLRMYLFLEAILKRFGFIKDHPYNAGVFKCHVRNKQTYPFRYIHYTGALFITMADPEEGWGNYGYLWTTNVMLTKRWKSSVTLDNEATLNLVHSLRDFCEDKEGMLGTYMNTLVEKGKLYSDENVFVE